jgi:hypothetical protein
MHPREAVAAPLDRRERQRVANHRHEWTERSDVPASRAEEEVALQGCKPPEGPTTPVGAKRQRGVEQRLVNSLQPSAGGEPSQHVPAAPQHHLGDAVLLRVRFAQQLNNVVDPSSVA